MTTTLSSHYVSKCGKFLMNIHVLNNKGNIHQLGSHGYKWNACVVNKITGEATTFDDGFIAYSTFINMFKKVGEWQEKNSHLQ